MFEAPFGFIVQFCIAFLALGLINFTFLIVYRCVYGQNCYLLSNFSGTFISGLYFRFHAQNAFQFQLDFILILSCQFVWYIITYRRSAAAWKDPLGRMQPPRTALGTAKGVICFFLALFCYKYSSDFLRFLHDPSRRALTLYS